MKNFNLKDYEITVEKIHRNLAIADLVALSLKTEKGSTLSDSGALIVYSGKKTGRSPKDKRIVSDPESEKNIWWEENIKLTEHTFIINKVRAIDYLNICSELYVVDAFVGWSPENRIKIRIICNRPYHALFMSNMLIIPTEEELKNFGKPDYVIYNGGGFPANRYTSEMSSTTSVDLSFEKKEFVILGTEYAGEMKKGVFTIMNYLMPKKNILPMHCSANEGKEGDVSIFFGLSGTGKTTLSADPNRYLIGDDEHCWDDKSVFNIEGGCYAKTINLKKENEPEIYNAIKFGTILENVVYDKKTHVVDYTDGSITENTRASYPIKYISNAKIPCITGQPNNVIFLTCDAFGILPPVSKLTPEQASYHFISGYTAKVAGTEMGVTEPEATFSACFGAPFMVWHPNKYATLLAKKLQETGATAWLVNTGWTGGAYGEGERISIAETRAILNAIHDGSLKETETIQHEIFKLQMPTSCKGVRAEILNPVNTWQDKEKYQEKAKYLATLFKTNFKQFEETTDPKIVSAGPGDV